MTFHFCASNAYNFRYYLDCDLFMIKLARHHFTTMYKALFSGDCFFTEEHEWIRVEGNIAFVGLTTIAKKELGQIHQVEIHMLGKDLTETQVFGRIRSRKYLCKLIMPIRGKIVAANEINYTSFNKLDKDFDPEEWIVKIEIALPFRAEKLYTPEQYKKSQAEGALHLVKYFLRFGE